MPPLPPSKDALEVVTNSGNQSSVVDLLTLLLLKRYSDQHHDTHCEPLTL